MQVRQVDVEDDELLRRIHEVWVASRSFERPWNDPQSFEFFALECRFEDAGEEHRVWGAFDGDLLVGYSRTWIPLHDNTSKLFADVVVAPDHRGRGAGTALLEQVVDVARSRSRNEVVGDLLAPADSTTEHPYRRFALKHGFAEASQDSMRHLPLPVPSQRLDELAAKAEPAWRGRYELATYLDGVPEPLQQSLCDAANLVDAEAPTGDIDFEPESVTPERYRHELELERDQGTHRLTTVALDPATSQVVAYTDLVVPGGSGRSVWQWGTLVRAEHRGHRLGMAVKVENLRRLQVEHPSREFVVTGNADANQWMVGINESLGFRVREICPMYQRRI
ncbi:GNAT family N-acetyltransferase [Angustibacter sp. McL0619]|uniref:GNAT family N-acetyltransferase n=1 Tax=Angustibacter sp. McL0619 TaxID=3415676 RepID=UPI003CE72BE9